MPSSHQDIADVFRAESHRLPTTPTPRSPGCDQLIPHRLQRGEGGEDESKSVRSRGRRRLRRLLRGEPTPDHL